ncbi:hypothetical protein T261_0811 [Streptomyces lydicus]|nr:hypothetical protein T261_0811 [Streptomyces lydicus]
MPRDLTRLLAHAECRIGLDADEQPLGLVWVGPVSREQGVVDLGLQVIDACQLQGRGTALARYAAEVARARGARTLTAFKQASTRPCSGCSTAWDRPGQARGPIHRGPCRPGSARPGPPPVLTNRSVMTSTPTPARVGKTLTALDHRIEAAVGRSIDLLRQHRDRGLLDEPHARLVDAHRDLVKAETSVTFYRVLLARLASGEFPVDVVLFARIDRTVDQLEEAAGERDAQQAKVQAALEPVETAARIQHPRLVSAPDFAALLAITQGAKLHEHLLTQRLSVATPSRTRISYRQLQRLEEAGFVQRDTSHPVHAGQPITLTEAGRAVLAGQRPAGPPGTTPAPMPAPGAQAALARAHR